MIVVDTNIICYLYLNDNFVEQAEKVLQIDSDWISSSLWKSEFRNILALYLRQGLVSFEKAIAILNAAEDQMSKSAFEPDSERVMQLVNSSNCSAYDCEYVALAQELNLDLLTADKKILAEFPNIAMSLESYLEIN